MIKMQVNTKFIYTVEYSRECCLPDNFHTETYYHQFLTAKEAGAFCEYYVKHKLKAMSLYENFRYSYDRNENIHTIDEDYLSHTFTWGKELVDGIDSNRMSQSWDERIKEDESDGNLYDADNSWMSTIEGNC